MTETELKNLVTDRSEFASSRRSVVEDLPSWPWPCTETISISDFLHRSN